MDNIKLNGVRNVQAPKVSKVKKQHIPEQAPDSYSNKEFKLGNAMNTLENIKTTRRGEECSKFSNEELDKLQTAIKKDPEKWESIRKLATTPFVNSRTVVDLASRKKDILDAVIPFATEPAKDKNNTSKYKSFELAEMADFAASKGVERLNRVKPLIKTQLSGDNVLSIAASSRCKDKIDKIASKVLDMENVVGNNLEETSFGLNNYDTKSYVINVCTKDDQVYTEILDEDFKRQAVENESLYETTGKFYRIKKTNDLRNNTTSKVRLELDDGREIVTHEVRVVKDKNGKILRKEYTAPSDVKGIFDIKYVDAEGNEKIVSEGHVNKKTGITTIKKDMESLDGTRTIYSYEDDPQGNRISDYKIVDKNGKVLLNNSNTFEVVDKNKFISSKNDQKYEITVDKHELNVRDLNNPERHATISIDKQISGNKKEIMKSLKAMPGEELFKLAQSTKSLVGIDNSMDAYFDPGDKSIHSGSNLFVIMHELGHARNYKDVDGSSDESFFDTHYKSIMDDKEVQKVYEKERKAFNKAFPDTQRNHIDYFINKLAHYNGKWGGLDETIAESNALLTTPYSGTNLTIRSQYLQQYFPRTIALLDQKSNEALA